MKIFSFDIETGPMADTETALQRRPFENKKLKDPTKIEKAKAEHIDKMALDPITGEVLTIGYGMSAENIVIETRWEFSEQQLINRFWEFFEEEIRGGKSNLVGKSCFNFDLPFLVGRSHILGLHLPRKLFVGRHFNPRIYDLGEVWDCFRYGKFTKLDSMAQAMGLGSKPEDGSEFHKLFTSDAENDRERAIEYAAWDVQATWSISNMILFEGR